VSSPSLRAVLSADEGRGETEVYLLPINNASHEPLAPNSSGREASSPRYQKKPSRATQEGAASRRESVPEEHVRPASLQTGVAEGTC